ncbi:amino acid ABC transporter substrate-binding protein [Roseibium polysiphoniae]|uniref:Amino acid ABC transporter substrate-binding protein n=1 Tax=Roseibium polysiphoniae TaxID=2571221 RepID=A0A944GTN2_9HYPH|nr:transporter substrate-binding domain-containing protein [Roseibium polysiphoniae]MBS8260635.1 amino acid ABC transporter substrate-binding protein [Roseibium polysiphoniae]
MATLKSNLIAAGLLAAATFVTTPSFAGEVMDEIKERGSLICLVNTNSPGFSVPDSNGVYEGFNPQFCRMAAAAIFGDAEKADIRGIGFSDSMKTIVAGDADMASRSITATGTRDADPGMAFVVTTFYDGQGFMVPKSLGITSAAQLDGATVCAEEGSTTLLNIADWFSDRDMSYKVENIADKTARLQAFYGGKCDVLSSDFTALASDRLLSESPDDYIILPDVISNEPLTLVTRPDQQLEAAVFWAFQVMLWAERFDINSVNVEEIAANLETRPKSVRRLLGKDSAMGDIGAKLGLHENWAVEVIKQVGNYGEVFERAIGLETPIGIDRKGTPNRLWVDGGLLYANPIR